MTEVNWSQRYAVVDLEATGTGRYAKIIQIGIVLVENGQITQQYETDINPYESLDMHIQQLTGITDEQLALAPDFSQVAGEIYELIRDAVFVAHNVQFDANLLAEALFLEGYELRTSRVDTVELAQVFFPGLEKYGLSHLAQELNIPLEQAHTAMEDALATAQLLQRIQEKIIRLPRQTVEVLAELGDNLIYESRLVIDELLAATSPYLREEWVAAGPLIVRKDKPVLGWQKESDQTANLFSQLELEERPIQQEFAQAVEKGLVASETFQFIQAPAGIGKTYGYLLPLLAKASSPLLVLVPTLLLQEQIMDKEGHPIQDVLGVSFSSIKSARHYLDMEKFWASLQQTDENRLLNRCKMQILVWLTETLTGDMRELKQQHVFPTYFDSLRHTGYWRKDGVFAEWDFWYKALERARSSRVLVTNHAFFLQHHQRLAELFHQRLVVIDEAQKFLVQADQVASQRLSMEEILALLDAKLASSPALLTKRLLESTIFEIKEWLRLQEETGLSTYLIEDKGQLLQNVEELADADFWEFKQVLEAEGQLYLEEDRREGTSFLRVSHPPLLKLEELFYQEKVYAISAGLFLDQPTTLLDLYGCPQADVTILPQDRNLHQLLVEPHDVPSLLTWSQADHAAFLAEQLDGLSKCKKPILALFTSKSLLLETADKLEERGVAHLAQYRHESEDQLKRKFDREVAPILLGTGLFWEGVDFSSHPQLIQVITRLPFENPQDSFVKKVHEELRQAGKSAFSTYTLPMMMLKLSQALGRTTRFDGQESLVVLLDPRLATKRYGSQVRAYLQETRQLEQAELAQLPDLINAFFER